MSSVFFFFFVELVFASIDSKIPLIYSRAGIPFELFVIMPQLSQTCEVHDLIMRIVLIHQFLTQMVLPTDIYSFLLTGTESKDLKTSHIVQVPISDLILFRSVHSVHIVIDTT